MFNLRHLALDFLELAHLGEQYALFHYQAFFLESWLRHRKLHLEFFALLHQVHLIPQNILHEHLFVVPQVLELGVEVEQFGFDVLLRLVVGLDDSPDQGWLLWVLTRVQSALIRLEQVEAMAMDWVRVQLVGTVVSFTLRRDHKSDFLARLSILALLSCIVGIRFFIFSGQQQLNLWWMFPAILGLKQGYRPLVLLPELLKLPDCLHMVVLQGWSFMSQVAQLDHALDHSGAYFATQVIQHALVHIGLVIEVLLSVHPLPDILPIIICRCHHVILGKHGFRPRRKDAWLARVVLHPKRHAAFKQRVPGVSPQVGAASLDSSLVVLIHEL